MSGRDGLAGALPAVRTSRIGLVAPHESASAPAPAANAAEKLVPTCPAGDPARLMAPVSSRSRVGIGLAVSPPGARMGAPTLLYGASNPSRVEAPTGSTPMQFAGKVLVTLCPAVLPADV